jgi:hypothetical protein
MCVWGEHRDSFTLGDLELVEPMRSRVVVIAWHEMQVAKITRLSLKTLAHPKKLPVLRTETGDHRTKAGPQRCGAPSSCLTGVRS